MTDSCTRLWLLLSLAALVRGLSGNVTKYRVLVLLPLSGEWETRGRAQLAGIREAVRERENGFKGVSYVDVHLEYYDTQCDPTRESSEVLFRLLRRDRRLVVLGGNCDRKSSDEMFTLPPDSLAGLRSYVPQATFEDVIPSADISKFLHSTLTRPSMTSANDAILAFIRHHGWRRMVAIYDQDIRHAQAATAMSELAETRQVNVSLRTEWNGEMTLTSLRDTRVRTVALYMMSSLAVEVMCQAERKWPGRFTWLVATRDREGFSAVLSDGCDVINSRISIVLFEVSTANTDEVKKFAMRANVGLPTVTMMPRETSILSYEAGLAYDTAGILLGALERLLLRDDYDRAAQQATFSTNLSSLLRHTDTHGVTGRLKFDDEGVRQMSIGIYLLQGLRISRIGIYDPTDRTQKWSPHANISLGPGTVSIGVRLDGTPLFLFVFLCALALVGIIYTAAILVFNIAKQKEKIVKMTSPNINVFILVGVISAYMCMPILVMDSGQVTVDILAALSQASAYLLSMSFTIIYGAVFAKSWRVYMIFKNLAVDGKMTRDEHLLFGVSILVLLDLTILLPWTILDPIRCERIISTVLIQEDNYTDVSVYVDTCSSRHQTAWVCLLYAYKTCVLAAGIYFTWQTRHVTLPSLKDTKRQYTVIYNVIAMAILALPVLFSRCTVGGATMYVVGVLGIWFTLMMTVTLLFLPKVWLWRRERKEVLAGDSTQFLFSESMRKTREAVHKCGVCFCVATEGDTEDRYAEEVLTTEIETLKRTVKEKDATIRELTDRLYFGSEKFQEYLHSPRNRNSMLCEIQRRYARRTVSQPLQAARTSDSFGEDRMAIRNSFGGAELHRIEHLPADYGTDNTDDVTSRVTSRQQLSARDLATMNQHLTDGIPNYRRSPNTRLSAHAWSMRVSAPPRCYDNLPSLTALPSTSPPHDSAIDNTSPSTDGSDRDIETEAARQRRPLTHSKRRHTSSSGFTGSAHDLYTSSIDLTAMESDAKVGQWTERQGGDADEAYNEQSGKPEGHRFNRSFYERRNNAVAVSEI